MNALAADAPNMNPFPGLRPFREEEEHLFFGRERQVDAMVDKLAATRFLAVVGTSGSGKSSLVNCGLRPALRLGLMPGAGTAWRMAQFRPGGNPLRAMARALAQDGVLFCDYQAEGLPLEDIIETTLRMTKLGLIDIYEQARLGEGVNLLLVVDQFEELFRYRELGVTLTDTDTARGEDAMAFVNLLLEVKEQTGCPIFVVLTMRSDFLGDCTHFPGLAEAINAGQSLVPRMSRDERRAAIARPIAVGGADIASVLLTRLVNDVGDNPDQLSILQHSLNRTWAFWEDDADGEGPLDLSDYEAIGTMAHALDQHAEKAYDELGGTRQQQTCEKLFKALTDKATDPRGVRRPTNLGTLCKLADATQAELTQVIDVFRKPSRSFLMPPAGDALQADTVIDISHESLMRVWERLKAWADQEADSARTYRRLAETAKLYAAGKASLWTGPDLQLALAWRDQNQPNETWAERYSPGFKKAMRFLDESRKVQEGDRQRELARTRAVWILVPLMLPLALIIQLADNFTHDLSYLYIPLAAWLGYAFRRTGVSALAMGACLLLPPALFLGPTKIPSDVGLYLVSLAVCRIFAEPDGFFIELNRFRDTRRFYLLAFLLLGVTTGLSFWNMGMPLGVYLDLYPFVYGAFFIFGMSAAPVRRFAVALAVAVAAGALLRALTSNAIPSNDWHWTVSYWLSHPWDYVKGLMFFACGRLTRTALMGRADLRTWRSVAVAALAVGALFAGSFASFSLQVRIPDLLSPLEQHYVVFALLVSSDALTYVAGFTVVLLLGARGLGAMTIGGAGGLIAVMAVYSAFGWQPHTWPILDGIALDLRRPLGWSEAEFVLIVASFGLLGNAVRKRVYSIGNAYAPPENEPAARAAEESARRTKKWLRWTLTGWGVATMLLVLVGAFLIFVNAGHQ